MTVPTEGDICRRDDGSIDMGYYVVRAAALRRNAMRENPETWLRNFREWLLRRRGEKRLSSLAVHCPKRVLM